MAQIINSDDFEKEVLSEKASVPVDFFSETCPPCRIMSPIIDEIGEEGIIKTVKVNVALSPDLADRYGIYAVPTMIIFRNGEEVNRIVGALSKEELLAEINK